MARPARPKRKLYKCLDGPWVGETILLVPSMPGDTATMTIRVKGWHGRYVFDKGINLKWVDA